MIIYFVIQSKKVYIMEKAQLLSSLNSWVVRKAAIKKVAT